MVQQATVSPKTELEALYSEPPTAGTSTPLDRRFAVRLAGRMDQEIGTAIDAVFAAYDEAIEAWLAQAKMELDMLRKLVRDMVTCAASHILDSSISVLAPTADDAGEGLASAEDALRSNVEYWHRDAPEEALAGLNNVLRDLLHRHSAGRPAISATALAVTYLERGQRLAERALAIEQERVANDKGA